MLVSDVPLPSDPGWFLNRAAGALWAALLSPAPCLHAACAWGGRQGLSGLGALLGHPQVLPWGWMWAGGASASSAHSGRKYLLLLPTVLQDEALHLSQILITQQCGMLCPCTKVRVTGSGGGSVAPRPLLWCGISAS